MDDVDEENEGQYIEMVGLFHATEMVTWEGTEQ